MIIAFALFISMMVFCLITGTSLLLGLLAGYVIFFVVALKRGNSVAILLHMTKDGAKDAMPVFSILMIIGVLTASWRASGTVVLFVYYGVQIITPKIFILMTFLFSCLLSFAIGTSFGVVGTMGVIFMALARFGGVNEVIAAGTIMSGIYFGDRCSPASSSMIFTAAMTNTNYFENMKALLKTGWMPLAVSLLLYGYLSFQNPILYIDRDLVESITDTFSISAFAAIPALLMIGLSLLGIEVKISMVISIISAGWVAIAVQKISFYEFLRCCLYGYQNTESFVGNLLKGGGAVSMLEISAILLISCAYSRILNDTGLLAGLQNKIEGLMKKTGKFPVTVLCSIIFSAIFCSQTIAIAFDASLLKGPYENSGSTRKELAVDIGNSAILISALIPWAIASSVPLKVMGVGMEALPYAFFLYLVPLINFLMPFRWQNCPPCGILDKEI